MKNKISFFFKAPFIILFFSTTVVAQDLPGKRDSIYSDILKEKRVIQVLLPENYKPELGEKYEVLYVLDGDTNIKSIFAIQQFAQEESYMPPIIIVAVFNTDRDRDFLPTHLPDTPTSGGADNFLAFFKNELIPYINKSYPSNGDNLLFGHSFGGVFSMYALLKEPQLFNSYLAVDPSFWWDNGYINKLAADKLSTQQQFNKSLFITGREGGGLNEMGIPGMDSVLKSKAPKELNWKIVAYPNESHGSVRLKSVYDGLKYFYEGYTNATINFYPVNGIVLKDKPYKIYYFDSSQSVRYTTDGTAPTLSSMKLKRENTLTNATKVSVKSFGNYDRYNAITVGEFKIGTTFTGIPKPKELKQGGFHYSYFEGEWDKLPDFEKLKPIQSGITNNFNFTNFPRKTNFACLIEGYIEIQKEGYYFFALDSDDGSKLFIGNNLIMDHDGLHAGGNPKSYLIPLAKGFYPIRIEYFQKVGGAHLELVYTLPGDEELNPIPFPLELQYSK